MTWRRNGRDTAKFGNSAPRRDIRERRGARCYVKESSGKLTDNPQFEFIPRLEGGAIPKFCGNGGLPVGIWRRFTRVLRSGLGILSRKNLETWIQLVNRPSGYNSQHIRHQFPMNKIKN